MDLKKGMRKVRSNEDIKDPLKNRIFVFDARRGTYKSLSDSDRERQGRVNRYKGLNKSDLSMSQRSFMRIRMLERQKKIIEDWQNEG